ncbi:MAG: DUF2804 domain-containing protein [Acutalibacteraceae bacterium]
MSKQNQITYETPLLADNGQLFNPGYCKNNLFVYNKENISASKWRLKEWDFYQTSDGEYMVQLNFFNISIASALTAEIRNLKTGEFVSDMALELITPNKNPLDQNADRPSHFEYAKGGRKAVFDVGVYSRHLYFEGKAKGKPFIIDLTMEKQLRHESLTIATPFEQKGRFFYTQKINCMPTKGTVTVGDRKIEFSNEKTFTVLDWGRGVWPHSNMWYWANGSTFLNGKLFGFELTWGFGDESNATETAIFYDGVCHKLGTVRLEKDPEIGESWMKPWHFIDENGKFDMTMVPYYDNFNDMMPLGLIGMKTHQVHGLWSGKAVLDDGTVLEVKDMYAFCEKVYNKW